MLIGLLNIVPDVYIDTMGYSFTFPIYKYLGSCKVGSYVHYPTISTDMLDKVKEIINAGKLSGEKNIIRKTLYKIPPIRKFKLYYYNFFAFIYGLMGSCCEMIIVNSNWTKNHINHLWVGKKSTKQIHVIFPPCNTRELCDLPLLDKRENIIISIAQFRPEKDHALQIKSLAHLKERYYNEFNEHHNIKLVLIGSCRNEGDENRISNLRNLAEQLGLKEDVDFEFAVNVSYDKLKSYLERAHIGLHTMWCEHFGIGVVELLAAGVITIAHNSGGPKTDIVVPYNDNKTGFLASTVEEYSNQLYDILKYEIDDDFISDIRINARKSVNRFSEESFYDQFLEVIDEFIKEN
eukprot:TRINITY_DN2050_c0_g1_i1.p1 TRINITY_DN2050_c0_g1~~TRINITY_DN2050_c0_g1_i1.p1  ORF type:complete len:349 (-),score=81.97 TRINITY_DN2050_c0_g1_i1:64-1110(-)